MASLPIKYKWLLSLSGLPRTIQLALELYGTKEVVGKGSNPEILKWRNLLNDAGINIKNYFDDDIPWCGLFVAYICYLRKLNPAEVVIDPLWARNWASYGKKADRPALGDILVFKRESGGHVGFYVAEDADSYHVLGGNQSNQVSIVRVEKSRLLAARRPPYMIKPSAVKHYHVVASGTLSQNEA